MIAGEVPRPITNSTAWLQKHCSSKVTGRELYAVQDLYTIYVHRRLDAEPFLEDSIFSGREIYQRYAHLCHVVVPADVTRDTQSAHMTAVFHSCGRAQSVGSLESKQA